MENLPCPDVAREWNEAKQKLTEAFVLTRRILETATRELAECETRLNHSLISVDGTLEKLGIELGKSEERA